MSKFCYTSEDLHVLDSGDGNTYWRRTDLSSERKVPAGTKLTPERLGYPRQIMDGRKLRVFHWFRDEGNNLVLVGPTSVERDISRTSLIDSDWDS